MRSAVSILALALAAGACGGKHAASPRVAPPALFASIPADTPYVVASFEAIPLDVLATFRDALGGLVRAKIEHPDGEDEEIPAIDDAYGRLAAAFFAELDGKWTAAGMESLGFSATPRFALYGLGLYPVARIEIRDGALLLGTIERIARRARLPLPPPETRDGRKLWRIVEDDHAFVVAIAADQLVLAYAPPAELEARLPLVLGSKLPARSMADGAALAGARERHRLGGHAIAIADTAQLATQLIAAGRPTPACTAEIERLARRVPRLVAGYAIGTAGQEAALVVELAPDLVGELRAARTELPGLAEAAADRPLLMMAGGVDLPRGQALAVAAAGAIRRVAGPCGGAKHERGADELAAALGRPIPPPLSELRGGVVSIKALSLAEGRFPLPTALEGFALASSPSAPALLELARAAVSQLVPLDFGADGKLHQLPPDRLPITPPFELFAGAGPRAIVLAAGAQGRRAAERALAAPPAAAPLLVTDGDYGRLSELRARLGGDDADVMAARARLYGRMHLAVDVTDRGLELRMTVETRPRGR